MNCPPVGRKNLIELCFDSVRHINKQQDEWELIRVPLIDSNIRPFREKLGNFTARATLFCFLLRASFIADQFETFDV